MHLKPAVVTVYSSVMSLLSAKSTILMFRFLSYYNSDLVQISVVVKYLYVLHWLRYYDARMFQITFVTCSYSRMVCQLFWLLTMNIHRESHTIL